MSIVKHKFNCNISDDPTAISAGQVVPSNWNDDHNIVLEAVDMLNIGPFKLLDYDTYITSYGRATFTSETGGLKIVTSGNEYIKLNKTITPDITSITLTATCKTATSAYIGLATKNGTAWGGTMYANTTGARNLLAFESTSFVSGGSAGTVATYGVDDVITVQIHFVKGVSYIRTSVNGVHTSLYQLPTAVTSNAAGDLYIVIRSASTWESMTLEFKKTESSATYFVATTGSDTINNGLSPSSPFSSISRAVGDAKDNFEIVISGGDYFDDVFALTAGIRIIGAMGEKVRLIYGTRYATASLVGGYTKVYSVSHAATLTSAYTLWQHDVPDVATLTTVAGSHPLHRGAQYRLGSTKSTWLASLAALEASDTTRSYFYWSAGILYFTIVAGSDLAVNPIVVPDGATVIGPVASNRNIRIQMSNIQLLYRSVNLSKSIFDITDCAVLYSNAFYGWQYGECVGGVFRRCEAGGTNYYGGTGGDGFNGSTTVPSNDTAKCTSIISYDNWSHDNEDDGDSLHNHAESSIFGGLYEFNGSGVTPASGGHMSIYNAIIRNNTYNGAGANGSPTDSGIDTSLLCNGCVIADNGLNNVPAVATNQNVILINCVSVNGAFPTTNTVKYNCVDI